MTEKLIFEDLSLKERAWIGAALGLMIDLLSEEMQTLDPDSRSFRQSEGELKELNEIREKLKPHMLG